MEVTVSLCGHFCRSSNPCSDIFHGPGPMSEPETVAIERLLMDELPATHTLVGAIDWHSFGKLILTPYGWTIPTLPPNDAEVPHTFASVHP
jgi:hypothetical protein